MLIQEVYQPVTPLGALAAALLVPVIGFISSKLYDGLKTIIPQYDRLPAIVHQVVAPLFGAALGFVAGGTGAEVLTDIHFISAGWIGAVLNALAMAGIKRWEKAKEPVDATVVLESSRKAYTGNNLGAPRTPGGVRRSTTPGA